MGDGNRNFRTPRCQASPDPPQITYASSRDACVELKGDDRIHRRDEKGMKAEGWGMRLGSAKQKAEMVKAESGKRKWPVSTRGLRATSLKTRLRNRFFASGHVLKRRSERRSARRPGAATHGYRRSEYETTTQVSSLPDAGMGSDVWWVPTVTGTRWASTIRKATVPFALVGQRLSA